MVNNKILAKLNHRKYNNNECKEREMDKKTYKDNTIRKLYKKIFRKKIN